MVPRLPTLSCLGPVVLVLIGCTIEDLRHEGRFCSPDHTCAEGFTCDPASSTCVAVSGLDAQPIEDGKADAPIAPEDAPGKEGPPDGPGSSEPTSWDFTPQLDASCPGSLTNCGGYCVDILTDYSHCGGCNQPCIVGAADRCESGSCLCGWKPQCTGGLNCSGGDCACITGTKSLCQGCCLSGGCYVGNMISACGIGAVACKVCKTADTCKIAQCTSGVCSYPNAPDGTSCPGGTCKGGVCNPSIP